MLLEFYWLCTGWKQVKVILLWQWHIERLMCTVSICFLIYEKLKSFCFHPLKYISNTQLHILVSARRWLEDRSLVQVIAVVLSFCPYLKETFVTSTFQKHVDDPKGAREREDTAPRPHLHLRTQKVILSSSILCTTTGVQTIQWVQTQDSCICSYV